jgi:hypothetical protein
MALLRVFLSILGAASLAQDITGAELLILWCDSSAPLQRWALPGDGTIRLASNASACVSSVPFGAAGERTLTVAPCGSSSVLSQHYTYADFTVVDGNAFAWNDQWGNSANTAGGATRLWPTSGGLSFNSYFTFLPATSQFAANFTQPGNATWPGLCVTAAPPPPPVPPPVPTAAQAAWQQGGEVGCFVHFNMATMAGTQGCGGGPPPPLSAWAPTAVDTDAWVSACAAMGGVRVVYVAKHGCGFTAWRSNVTLYGVDAYSVKASAYPDVDVAASLVASAKRAGMGCAFCARAPQAHLRPPSRALLTPNPAHTQ